MNNDVGGSSSGGGGGGSSSGGGGGSSRSRRRHMSIRGLNNKKVCMTDPKPISSHYWDADALMNDPEAKTDASRHAILAITEYNKLKKKEYEFEDVLSVKQTLVAGFEFEIIFAAAKQVTSGIFKTKTFWAIVYQGIPLTSVSEVVKLKTMLNRKRKNMSKDLFKKMNLHKKMMKKKKIQAEYLFKKKMNLFKKMKKKKKKKTTDDV